MLNPRVQALCVLAYYHQIHILVAALHTRHRSDRAQIGVQVERLANPHIDTAKPGPQSGSDRAF